MNNKIVQKIIDNKFTILLLSIFTFLLLFFCSQMSPLYPINDWSDVNLYFNIGKSMTQGHTLYTEAFDHKGPLIFFIYAIGYIISNDSFLGVFIIELLCWLAMSFTIYLSARIFLKKSYSLIASMTFLALILKFTGQGGSAEEFILIFESITLCLFLRYFKSDNARHIPAYMLIHGVLFSATVFIKINLAIFWIFPILAIFINILINKEYKNLFINFIAFIGGILIVAFPIWLYLYINNAVSDAYDIYIVFNRKYANVLSFAGIIKTLLVRAYDLLRSNIIIFILSLTGILYFPVRHIKNPIGKFGLILSGISLYTVIFMGLSFHYYYPLPFCIFVSLGLIAVIYWIGDYITIKESKPIYYFITTIVLLAGINYKSFFGIGGSVLLRQERPDNMAFQFNEIISEERNPTLLNLGFGLGNSVFTVGNIDPTVRYFITPNIPHGMYPDLRDSQTEYVKNKEVEFIILTNFSVNYDYFKDLPEFYNNYTLVDTYISNELIYRTFHIYYLYKRNN